MAEEAQDGKKNVGLPEVAAGAAAGATAAHLIGKPLADKPIKEIETKISNVAVEAAHAFYDSHPPPSPLLPTADPAAKAWLEGSHAAQTAAVAPLEKEAAALANPLTRPLMAFKNAPIPAKVGMGAAVAASAVGAGWLMNKWRTSGTESHVERLERERHSTVERSR